MDCTWHELVSGLVEEPALSLSVLEPDVGVGGGSGGGGGGGEGDNGGVFFVSPAGVVEQSYNKPASNAHDGRTSSHNFSATSSHNFKYPAY
uniref:Uncharacterized protein n=1 Tax=Oryza rufipogon TaxID=4529 RepID=A0A0E0PM13_ORYRU